MRIDEVNPYGPTSRDAIANFEMKWKIELPEDYKVFLLSSNGGVPIPNVIMVPTWEHHGAVVDFFYGIHDGPRSRLERAVDVYADRIPVDLIPIAADTFGNVVCIGWKGKRRGKIYFWDHENELDENGRGRTDYANVYLAANSLGEFLEKLKELED